MTRPTLAVVVGGDAEAAAAVAQAAEQAGARTAVFVGDLSDPTDRAALVELIAELG
jgi:NAD(P)-dependent dehydrogenase (short-subunit alcohol dehydrogenase family)